MTQELKDYLKKIVDKIEEDTYLESELRYGDMTCSTDSGYALDGINFLMNILEKEMDAIPRERIEQMKNEFIHIGEGTGWLDISLSECLEIIDKYTKEQNNE